MPSLIIKKNNLVISNKTTIADNWFKRMIGLLSYRDLKEGESLWLLPGKHIHTIGMRFNIDVVFLDRSMKVLKTVNSVKPFRLCLANKNTTSVLELPSGTLENLKLNIGDRLVIMPGNGIDEEKIKISNYQ